MNNHWTRALLECCDHTKPVCLPCDDCRRLILDKLGRGLIEEGRQMSVSGLHEALDSVKAMKKELADSEVQHGKLQAAMADRQKLIEALTRQNKDLLARVDDAERRLHAHEVDRGMKMASA